MNILLRLFYSTIVFSGLAWLIRRTIARKRATIILYHDPAPDTFDRHLNYLTQHYTIIPLADLVRNLGSPDQHPLPKNALVITFDDGHKGNAALRSVFERYRVPATIFLCTGIIDTGRRYWFKLPGLQSASYKGMDNGRRLETLRQEYQFVQEEECPAPEALTMEQIRSLSPWVDFQTHTCFHPILTRCSDEEAEAELQQDYDNYLRFFQQPPRFFAYPNGNYSNREIAILRQLGYQGARSTDIGWNDRHSDPFRLKVTGVSDKADLVQLKAELTGIPAYLYNMYRYGINSRTLRGKVGNT